MDLERSSRRGWDWWVRVRNKGGFLCFGKRQFVVLLGAFSSFQPSLGVSHEDLGVDFIL
jgi:hypothetical protein